MPAGSNPVSIKWPNDILIAGKKCCGILLEGEGLPDGRRALVIGCGINVALAPDHGALSRHLPAGRRGSSVAGRTVCPSVPQHGRGI